MKKITLLLVVVLLTTNIFAQDMGIGLRYGIGLNSASVSTGTNPSTSSISAVNAALIFEKGFSSLFAIQPELQYMSKGFGQDASGGGTTITTTSNFSYLGLNILPKVRFGNEQIEAFVLAGPSVNMKMSATMSVLGVSADIPNVESLDLSAVLGGGVGYKMASGKIFLDVRYNMALTKVNSTGSQDVKLNQIGINVGYIHNLSK